MANFPGYYLDNHENVSYHIISSNGCQLDNDVNLDEAKNEMVKMDYQDDLFKSKLAPEYKVVEDNPVFFNILEGELFIDIRDSADEWIRIILRAGGKFMMISGFFRVKPFDEHLDIGCMLITNINSIIDESSSRFSNLQDSLLFESSFSSKSAQTKELVCELCRSFYTLGWVTGTGGSISIRYGDRIYMTPSGVQKERIQSDELYILDLAGEVIGCPNQKIGAAKPPKLSDCSPLFLHAFKQRKAGAVIHSHGVFTNMATLIASLYPDESERSSFKICNQEMIKGIKGHGYYDTLEIPIIENTAHECELADEMGKTIANFPKSPAVLVRRHGMYVWGDSWEEAKRHAECLHYLFEVAFNMKQLGLDASIPLKREDEDEETGNNESKEMVLESSDEKCKRRMENGNHFQLNNNNKRQRMNGSYHQEGLKNNHDIILLDIEGTTTPISFVRDTLFPYVKDQVFDHLVETFDSSETQEDLLELQLQNVSDCSNGEYSDVPEVPDSLVTDSVQDLSKSYAAYVHWMIENDLKCPPLKQLQGHIWKKGYSNGSIQGELFEDVPAAMERWVCDEGKTVCIFSSGSREAQQLLFHHPSKSPLPLTPLISSYFDPKSVGGDKRSVSSYQEIALSLGYKDQPSKILFLTDILEEAQAAELCGMDVMILLRPGNHPIPLDQLETFKTTTNFEDI